MKKRPFPVGPYLLLNIAVSITVPLILTDWDASVIWIVLVFVLRSVGIFFGMFFLSAVICAIFNIPLEEVPEPVTINNEAQDASGFHYRRRRRRRRKKRKNVVIEDNFYDDDDEPIRANYKIPDSHKSFIEQLQDNW